jgi:hypothetical protein
MPLDGANKGSVSRLLAGPYRAARLALTPHDRRDARMGVVGDSRAPGFHDVATAAEALTPSAGRNHIDFPAPAF